jgi:hypothetical protein
LLPTMVPAFVQKLGTYTHLRVEGLMTHLATADTADIRSWPGFITQYRCLLPRA